jgi:hypothetical protein
MAVQVQILRPDADDAIQQVFTATGTALCMGNETITLNVLLATLDFGFALIKQVPLLPVQGLPGVNEWTVSYNANDSVPFAPYALYALAYCNGALTAQSEVTVDGGALAPLKRKQKKGKKAAKKK